MSEKEAGLLIRHCGFLSVSQLLHLSLKKSKVTSSDPTVLPMLDPFVLLLLDCLDSRHVKVLTFSFNIRTFLSHQMLSTSQSDSDILTPLLLSPPLQVITEALVAFTWLLKFPLPAVEQNADQMTKQLFVLLKDYSKAGAARGENYQLVQNCFKVPQLTKHICMLTLLKGSNSIRF